MSRASRDEEFSAFVAARQVHLRRIAYARLVRKGGGGPRLAHVVEPLAIQALIPETRVKAFGKTVLLYNRKPAVIPS